MSTAQVPDQPERDAALDPGSSFIVQAPAGSGKTELLIQRYLRLLALVDEPEEVLAVTFTRKAAGEMRSRVINALAQAQADTAPEAPHLRRAWELARQVLADERRQRWQLHRHSSRLHISTIDAVNTWLAGRSPVGSGGSVLREIATEPRHLYLAAARATLELMADDDADAAEVAALMRHLDNNAGTFEQLLVEMLPRRDQWLRHAISLDEERQVCEAPLHRLTEIGLQAAAASLPAGIAGELLSLLPYAASVLAQDGKESQLAAWAGRAGFPEPVIDELPAWCALADALLTAKDAAWRKTVNKNNGFPPQTPEKSRMAVLLRKLPEHDALRIALHELRNLPGSAYTDAQWEILRSLRAVLRLAAAQLRIVSATRGETDFADIAAAALDTLGNSDEPTEFGLVLDHRIQHILVDEFQDTSLAQFTLLERLTSGWLPGDGRTLFLVGDPMQSIYRFREADVGLFMQVRDRGIGQVRPQFLQLRANFRSLAPLVTWANDVFAQVFTGSGSALAGVVGFAPSLPTRGPGDSGDGVSWHWLPAGDDTAEPLRVLDLVAAARRDDPAQRLCILVRSRRHATAIITALRDAGIGFVAPEIESLEHSGVAQGLLALTRALCHRADRLAWIGVLRAPWCGLSLADLDHLLGDDHQSAVIDLLRDGQRVAGLSPAGFAAVMRLCAVLDQVDAVRERRGLRDLIEGAWLRLGGPATVPEVTQLESAATFFVLLDEAEAAPEGVDLAWLTTQLRERKGSLGSGDAGLQVMTIHKAKGLEFDTVIVPGLGRKGRGDDRQLLLWQDVPMGDGSTAPLLAPMPETGAGNDPVYGYLRRLEEEKSLLELDRLLYVACTRARRRLHLVAQLDVRSQDGRSVVRQPDARSLLRRLWTVVGPEAESGMQDAGWLPRAEHKEPVWIQPTIRRLPPQWQLPVPPPPMPLPPGTAEPATAEPVVYEWAGRLAMHVGSVVHWWLQLIATQGVEAFSSGRLYRDQPLMQRMLAGMGVPLHELDGSTARVIEALERTLADERGRWILGGSHVESASELALTVPEAGRFRNLVADRTFRTTDGTRWVIDYKTSQHQGAYLDDFIATEVERYRAQLCGYREAIMALTGEPVRIALYFPLLGVFREVVGDAAASG